MSAREVGGFPKGALEMFRVGNTQWWSMGRWGVRAGPVGPSLPQGTVSIVLCVVLFALVFLSPSGS